MDWLSPIKDLVDFIFPFLERLSVIRALLGFILIFFLPGFAWTLVFFKGKQINVIERIALSFGLSIASVTLSIFALNLLFGIRITGFNSAMVILTITTIPLILYYLNKYLGKQFREYSNKSLKR